MRLLYIANARIPTPRAYGIQIMKTCEAFRHAGVEVTLVAPRRAVTIEEDPLAYYRVNHRFSFEMLTTPDFLWLGSIGFLLSTLWFTEKVRYAKAFRTADVLYSRDALVLLQYLLLGRTYVYEAHGAPTRIATLVARHAKKLVVISEGLKDAYAKRGIAPERMLVARDAVDLALFDAVPGREEARKQLDLPQGPIALYAGHLYPRKGADVLAAAAAHCPEVQFIFVGGLREDVARFTERWGKSKNIQILGQVPHERIPYYLRAADVLVVPNSGNDTDAARYTSPMKLFEYLLSGTPIVASDVPALREVLTDATAIFVAPNDPHALAEGIQKALRDGSRAAAALALGKRFTWEARARAITDAM